MGLVDASKLDRLVQVLQPVAAQESTYGTRTVSWLPLDDPVWASVQDVLPSRAEYVAEAVAIARRPCRVRMRWREDVTSQMRLRLEDGRVLRITAGPAEIGRREGIELMAEELTTEGQDG